MAAVAIRGTSYPVVLPKLRDPRLHLAATITSLQILGQVAFHFRLSIAQILLCLGTCAVLEIAITFRTQRVIMWPASALLTGNGVAFVLRLPSTHHGDWWTFNGWWIYVATAGGSLLSKYVIKWRGEHIFNPSNIGLVVVFLALGRTRVEPLDFWWGPMSWWMALALVIIVTGGFAILSRLKLLRVALSFWAAFAVGVGGLALAGHVMTARWHLGPITGFSFWWVLVTSPEVLVFLFFMITDPKTAPKGLQARVAYGITLGMLAAVLIAPTRSEFAAKVALLASLAVLCIGRAVFDTFPVRLDRRRIAFAGAAAAAAYVVVAVVASSSPSAGSASRIPTGQLPPITILPSPGVQTSLDRTTAEVIAHDLLAVEPLDKQPLRLHLEPGTDQGPPVAVAQSGTSTYRLDLQASGVWTLANAPTAPAQLALPQSNALVGQRLTNVAPSVGLDFRQGSFRFGVSDDYESMMGGGVCWLDYNNDGWQDLFAVNSYSGSNTQRWEADGGLPTAELFENVHGVFVNVSAKTHANLAVQGDGCVAADLNGDGRTDLVVTTTEGVKILWNDGGRFHAQTLKGSGWYTGAAVADVNGDGRPDIFVAGYSQPNEPVANSIAGFPSNLVGVRDLLYLNEGGGRFREVGVQAGIEAANFRHGLGAEFVDVNHDGRPDLYVANDEDPNQLYVNVPWPGGAAADPLGLGFRFEERASAEGVADPFAGMGIASTPRTLFVTNSRGEPSAVYAQEHGSVAFANARPTIDPALGDGFAGWGASWVDVANSGNPDLILTAGAIPVRSLEKDAEPLRVLAPKGGGAYGVAKNAIAGSLKLNGRGLAAADVDNNGRMQIAINTIGGRLALLRPSGSSGHWLDVSLSRFVPGAVVTADGVSQEVHAGSSYLSSEDPRVHFGLGARTVVRTLVVRYPWGGQTVLHDVRADQVLEVKAPAPTVVRNETASSPVLGSCKSDGVNVANFWVENAALAVGRASEPVQARDLYDLSLVMYQAWKATKSTVAVNYAAYRLLLWQASFDTNLASTFSELTKDMQSLCLSPYFVPTSGDSPAAVGNRIAAAAIAASRNDGSNEALHYADPSYTAVNAPLIVGQYGSTVHDATFWQPLALTQIAPKGVQDLPGDIQGFEDSQWGHVRTFAGKVAAAKPPYNGDPTGRAYVDAALGVIRATAGAPTAPIYSSPSDWNAFAAAHAHGTLEGSIRLYLTLNGALNDAAVSVWAAKREYQAPRPISMIRYLAFNKELPLTPGLVEKRNGKVYVRERDKWVLGGSWNAPGATPASPGGVSEGAAFEAAAAQVLGKPHASGSGLAWGIDTPSDEAAGRAVGEKVGTLAVAKARTLFR